MQKFFGNNQARETKGSTFQHRSGKESYVSLVGYAPYTYWDEIK